jgi:hypothetical protein
MLQWLICNVVFQPKATGDAGEATVKSVAENPVGDQEDVEAHPRMETQLETVTPHVSNPHDYVNHMFKRP